MFTTIKTWTARVLVAALIPAGLGATALAGNVFAQQCDKADVPTTTCNDGPGLGGGYAIPADDSGLGHRPTPCGDGPGLGGGY
jgi:hypothetical protein